MARVDYTVGPKAGNRKGWKVEANGRIVSRHNKKTTAIRRARELADRNDTVTVQGRDGKFQKQIFSS